MKIFFAPIKFSNKSLLNRLQKDISGIFSTGTELINLDMDLSKSYSPERKQYYSTKILESSILMTGYLNGFVIILTELDLYIPVLTFIFGEAQYKGKHSIVSVCRLHEEFYTGFTNDELLYLRTKKEVLHELGHNLGLLHCIDWDCVMHSSNSVEEVDIKGDFYCNHCVEEIKSTLNITPVYCK